MPGIAAAEAVRELPGRLKSLATSIYAGDLLASARVMEQAADPDRFQELRDSIKDQIDCIARLAKSPSPCPISPGFV
ncbi:MAG: hypothetical protein AB7W16_13230 [Candidatus Obscuribacterales bacterium]